MATMNVSIPEKLKAYVDSQVQDGDYGSTSEYIRELIRKDQDRRELRNTLLEGACSPITTNIDETYFASLRNQVEPS
ncbi:MAG: type II toxin-antitoxin system ParD family antitoxin [Acidimicrobiales bacterium]